MKTHLEITDMPRDNSGVFYGVRMPLVRIFNTCRDYPAKMTQFKNLMKFMYNKCVAFEKYQAQLADEKAKAAQTDA